jgi:hypothetical protein
MELKVTGIQAIPNYKQDSAATKEGVRKKEKPSSFREILKGVLKQPN